MIRFWTSLFAIGLIVSVGVALGSSGGTGRHPSAAASAVCGVERWPVKTLSDPDAEDVSFTPKSTTVSALRAKPAPKVTSSTPRIAGVETTTYKVRAKLIKYALEDDHDIHLVISSPSSTAKTMIVEFPDPSCPGVRDSLKKTAIGHARSAISTACGNPSTHFHDLEGTATISGVGFFDVKHPTPQTGVAPNGVELHPVLGFTDAVCSRP